MRAGGLFSVYWAGIAGAIAFSASLFCANAVQAAKAKVPPASPQAAVPRPASIDRNGTLILIRTTLIALDQGNLTGNYTVLRDLGAPGFREANTAARLAEIFVQQRGAGLDLSGVVVLEPQLTLLPQVEPNGMLHMAGFFPSVPAQINFELLFAPVNGRWQPFGISVNVGTSSPVAPSSSQPAQRPSWDRPEISENPALPGIAPIPPTAATTR